jgi:O-Antigen ligase
VATHSSRRLDASAVLIVLAWAYVVAPRLTQSLTAPKYRTAVTEPVPYSTQASLMEYASALLLAGWCVLVVAQRLPELPGDRRQALVLLLAPWVYLVCRDLYADTSPQLGSLLYPLAVIAVWVLRPRLDRLSLLGYLVGLTALLSLAIAALRPDKGLLTAVSGRPIEPDKQILPLGILVGPFTDGNNLAQFLVLGLATIGLAPHRGRRLLLGACTAFAIVFTSSRSSMAAMVAALLVGLVLAALPRMGRAVVGSVAVAMAVTLVALLPLLTHGDKAFTNRGAVWRVGLREWSTDPFFGLGSRYYSTIGQFANALGGNAFHGHNQLVQTLVTGGLVYLALTAAMMATLVAAAVRWARWGRSAPVALLVAFFVSCTLEVSFGVVDREFLFAVTVVPMAVLAFAPPPQTQPAQAQPASTTPTSSALTAPRAATSSAKWERRIHLPSATTTTASTRRDSARPSATRSTGGAFSSTSG